jgi:four helix bundle protein
MDNKEFGKELERRTRDFAIRVIGISVILPNTLEARIIREQLTKSGTSIGANYREANRSRSKADFKNRIAICESEASETEYWLEFLIQLKWIPEERIRELYNECGALNFRHSRHSEIWGLMVF